MTRLTSLFSSRKSAISLLALLFALSVVVRAPQFNEPLGKAHQWLTAHVLITLSIWEAEGIATHHFSPVYTFPGTANRHLQSLTSGLPDAEGRFYYVSYPPFAFLLPYFFFTLLHLTPSVLGMQLWSLTLHALTAFFVYALVASIYGARLQEGLFPPALVAYVLYLFMPLMLWYHMNVYFADMLVQPLWVATLWTAFQVYERDQLGRTSYLALFSVLIALTVYTEWLGVFTGFVLFVIALLRVRRDRRYVRVLVLIAVSGMFAIGLTVWQYSQIAGFQAFIDSSIHRFLIRSGVDASIGSPIERPLYYLMIGLTYWHRYYPAFTLLAFLIVAGILTKGRRPFTRWHKHRFMLTAIGAPILLHHFVFFDFTYIHDFSQLKSGVLFAYLAAGLYHHIRYAIFPETRRVFHAMVVAILAVSVCLGVYTYYQQIPRKDLELHRQTGEIIGRLAAENETIYVLGPTRTNDITHYRNNERAVSAPIQYYAGRNMLMVVDRNEVESHMRENGIRRAIVFTSTQTNTLNAVEHIRLDNLP